MDKDVPSFDQLAQNGMREGAKRALITDAAEKALNHVAHTGGLKEEDLNLLKEKISLLILDADPTLRTQQLCDLVIHEAENYLKSLQYEYSDPNMPVIGEAMAVNFEMNFLDGVRDIP